MDATTLHPNAERMLRIVAAFNRGETDGVADAFAPDAVWHAAGRNRHSGDHRGPAIGAWFAEMAAMDCQAELVDVMADDEHVAFFLHVRSEASDRPALDQVHANAWRFRDGRVVEGWFLPDDQAAWDAFAGG